MFYAEKPRKLRAKDIAFQGANAYDRSSIR